VASNTPKTVLTVRQFVPYVELAQDEDRQWHWCLWGANGRPLAMNAATYDRRNDAMQGAMAATKAMQQNPEIRRELPTVRKISNTKRRRKKDEEQGSIRDSAERTPEKKDSNTAGQEGKPLPESQENPETPIG
jgi:hypothetical protein